MKFKNILVITILILSGVILSGCTNSSGETLSKGNNTVNSETNTESKASQDKASEEDDSIIFKSKVGFSIRFPASWKNRYTIIEDDNSMYVYFKSTDPKTRPNTGFLFAVIKDIKPQDEGMYDSIDGEKHIIVGNTTYFIGGPTDVSLNPENSDFDIFVSMSNERKKVIDSITNLD